MDQPVLLVGYTKHCYHFLWVRVQCGQKQTRCESLQGQWGCGPGVASKCRSAICKSSNDFVPSGRDVASVPVISFWSTFTFSCICDGHFQPTSHWDCPAWSAHAACLCWSHCRAELRAPPPARSAASKREEGVRIPAQAWAPLARLNWVTWFLLFRGLGEIHLLFPQQHRELVLHGLFPFPHSTLPYACVLAPAPKSTACLQSLLSFWLWGEPKLRFHLKIHILSSAAREW